MHSASIKGESTEVIRICLLSTNGEVNTTRQSSGTFQLMNGVTIIYQIEYTLEAC
jgi:hypothetical protein